MKFMGRIKIRPDIPAPLARLKELAYNLWWSWDPDASGLFRQIDPALWESTHQNPVKFLLEVSQDCLEIISRDREYLDSFDKVMSRFDRYMKADHTWHQKNCPDRKNELIAYFSAEFGIHESIPIYSGGLGVLAGDHVKSASDIGLPLVGVGLLYKQGYFSQRITGEGHQEAVYFDMDFTQLPLNKVTDANGEHLTIDVDLPGRKVYAHVWFIQVGRVRIFLLDTNIPRNKAEDRWFTSQLYGGDQEMRITQEILLGMGGVRALRAMGLSPTVWHMNEGHSVFMGLERIRELVAGEKLSFYEALEAVKSNTVFTTHTPVPAGNDAFPQNLQARYFRSYWEKTGITEAQFMELGRDTDPGMSQMFSLTILALKLAGRANGVSELHGHVSRKLWERVWEGVPSEENPITHITNGIHTQSWIAPEIKDLYDRHLGSDWTDHLDEPAFWENGMKKIPDEELWDIHQDLKSRMVDFIRGRACSQWARHGDASCDINANASRLLDPSHFTVGFARRFATYKRAVLLFRDMDRIRALLNDPKTPMQIVFAGKAHPKDKPGQEFIRTIVDIAKQEGFRNRVFFIEDYDISVARHLVHGVDVWLNTPRRPLEASGTSGQKGPVSGIINFSVLDGWWREAYQANPESGWSIGADRDYPNTEAQDSEDARDIYSRLEQEILPLYYHRDKENIPVNWIKRMKESIMTVLPRFSTDRMVKDYYRKLYVPAMDRGKEFATDRFQTAKSVCAWKNSVRSHWNQVAVEPDSVTDSGDSGEASLTTGFAVNAVVKLGALRPEDVQVEIYYRKVDEKGNVIADFLSDRMDMTEDLGNGRFRYSGSMKPVNGGRYEYTVRVIPGNSHLSHKHETGLIRWID